MSRLDIVYGRKGGRILEWVGDSARELIERGELVAASCQCPDVAAWVLSPKEFTTGRCRHCGARYVEISERASTALNVAMAQGGEGSPGSIPEDPPAPAPIAVELF